MIRLILTLTVLMTALLGPAHAEPPQPIGPQPLPVPRVVIPAPDTIVDVEGDATYGFTITHFDGSQISPPTDSEARAECNEYRWLRQRIRCRVEVRVWHRELAVLRDALNWAHAQARLPLAI